MILWICVVFCADGMGGVVTPDRYRATVYFRQYVSVFKGSPGGMCMSDYAHYLCFVPKYLDGAPAKNKRFRVAPPHFGTKLQSFAINLPCTYRPVIPLCPVNQAGKMKSQPRNKKLPLGAVEDGPRGGDH